MHAKPTDRLFSIKRSGHKEISRFTSLRDMRRRLGQKALAKAVYQKCVHVIDCLLEFLANLVSHRNQNTVHDENLKLSKYFKPRNGTRLGNFFSPFTFHLSPRLAFTLAEVLITLGIIGVVAAMTIPTLMNNTGNSQYVTGLQKFYSEMGQAVIQLETDSGAVGDLSSTGLFAAGTTHDSLANALIPYFKVIKTCPAGTTGCWASSTAGSYDGVATAYVFDGSTSYSNFVTADGMSVGVYNYAVDGGVNVNCGFSYGSGDYNTTCATVYFDVNGPKPPNRKGRDVFAFFLTKNGVDLYGGSLSSATYDTYCVTGVNGRGACCAAKIAAEGWKMNY